MAEIEKFAAENEIPVQNAQLLNTALTHTSYANEHKNEVIHDNERLEFLGDAILDLVIGEYLFLRFPSWPEGELTRMRADMVCEKTLAKVANGKATKIIIPSELQNLGGVVPSIKELLTDPKDAE